MKMVGEITREALAQFGGVAWPDPFEGRAFVRCVAFERKAQYEDFRYLPPACPSNKIPTEWAWDDDTGERWSVEWRDATEAEWADLISSYEKAKAEWERTLGSVRVKSGPDIVSGTFESADGLVAKGRFGERQWHWLDLELHVSSSRPWPSLRHSDGEP